MAREIDWSIPQSNQASLSGQILDDNGFPVDLTDSTLSLVIKASASPADGDGSSFTPTVASGTQGNWTQTVSGSHFASAGTLWYRLDVVDTDSNHVTANFGTITVIAS